MASRQHVNIRRFYKTKRTPMEKAFHTFAYFFRSEATSGFILLACTALALAGANSPWAEDIERFWQLPFTVGFEGFALSKPLVLWVNDGLMAVFFFMVGLEIKREMMAGELAGFRKALSPILAAVAGMAAPAAVYLAFNHGTHAASGWGVPMATDIAFALCVLSLLGKRVPLSLKVFLTAVASVDDIGAVAVIAVFYTPDLSLIALGIGLSALALAAAGNALGARRTLFYLVLGLVAWVGFLKSGVHSTVAGVLMALCIPARSRSDVSGFKQALRDITGALDRTLKPGLSVLADAKRQALLEDLTRASLHASAPLLRMEHGLAPWVAYGVMPVFALANAGVSLSGVSPASLLSPVTLGVALGLLFGKLGGVLLSVWIMAKTGLAPLPEGCTWRHMTGVSLLAGIGFTMSLFIGQLAFHDPAILDEAKLAIIGASLLAGVLGYGVLRGTKPSS